MHFYASGNAGEQIALWQIDRLRLLAATLPRTTVALNELAELDEDAWFKSEVEQPTLRSVAMHAKRIWDADLTYPIILSAQGSVMDGLHRIAKAFMLGSEQILAVRFALDPPPDKIVPYFEFQRLCASGQTPEL